MQFAKVIVKKYENRRLYDTSNSRYVNLDDIAEMVRDGSEVQVINSVTGQDLTRLVMTQLVVESAKVPDSGFPLDLLRQMIIASGRASREGLLGYMKAMFDMYQNAYRTFTSGIAPSTLETLVAVVRPPRRRRPKPVLNRVSSRKVRSASSTNCMSELPS